MRDGFRLFMSGIKCVEVGVSAGANAVSMLEAFPLAQFYLVDNYDVGNSTFQFGGKVFTSEEREDFISKVTARLAVYGSRAKLLVMDSAEASREFPDESLDFVYIDAQHEYEAVLRDLRAWYPKVKRGGVIAGDDCGESGVKQAVTEFFPRGLSYGTGTPDWVVSK